MDLSDVSALLDQLRTVPGLVHASAYGSLAWLMLTFTLNALFRFESTETLVSWIGKVPKVGPALLSAIRHLGADPVKILEWIKARLPGSGSASGGGVLSSGPSAAPPRANDGSAPALHRGLVGHAMAFAALCTIVLGVAGCAGFWTENRKEAVTDVTECVVLETAQAAMAGPITPATEAAIAARCALNPDDVHKIIAGSSDAIALAKVRLASARLEGVVTGANVCAGDAGAK